MSFIGGGKKKKKERMKSLDGRIKYCTSVTKMIVIY